MKKNIVVTLFVVILAFINTSCWFVQEKLPKTGVYYCDELKISINLSKANDPNIPFEEGAKIYEGDNYKKLAFRYGQGTHISICEEFDNDDSKYYILGNFKWKNNEIIVENNKDGQTYVFEKLDVASNLPKKGAYYCDELKINIYFSDDVTKKAVLYTEDGKKDLTYCIDYGNRILIEEYVFATNEDGEEQFESIKEYLYGTYNWEKDKFIVTQYSDGKTFVFEKQ